MKSVHFSTCCSAFVALKWQYPLQHEICAFFVQLLCLLVLFVAVCVAVCVLVHDVVCVEVYVAVFSLIWRVNTQPIINSACLLWFLFHRHIICVAASVVVYVAVCVAAYLMCCSQCCSLCCSLCCSIFLKYMSQFFRCFNMKILTWTRNRCIPRKSCV